MINWCSIFVTNQDGRMEVFVEQSRIKGQKGSIETKMLKSSEEESVIMDWKVLIASNSVVL